GYEYNETKSLANLNGVLFTTGHGKVKDIFSIENTSFYDYEYTITNGSGKDRRSKTYYYVVSEIDIGCELPHILINNGELKQINYGSFTNIAEVNLPDNFEKKYNVTIDKGLEVELFQILTPDIMDLLLNKYTEYSIEICDSKIFLIKYGINSTDEKLSVKEKQLKELKILADILYDRFVAVSKYIKEHNKKQDTKKDYKNNISQ
ncbi:MAG: hypothetical protein QM532_03675, partial [Cyanobium sp. MAG06]|nr:hypothetical protein [Cyanobium sp. MAG06]